MSSVLHGLGRLDRATIESVQALRWGPATGVFVLLSAWWVKGPLLVGLGTFADLRSRRWLPWAGVGATLAALLGSAASSTLKELVGRVRPPIADPHVIALGSLPATPSFPSGHATTAFAAAVVVGALHPRLRLPVLGLAALVGISRVYLGVHYAFDVLAGAGLGIVLGLCVVWTIRRLQTRAAAY